jgi:hypothetical protein
MSNDEGRIDETARKTADQFFVMYDTVEYAERERLAGLIETALAEQQALDPEQIEKIAHDTAVQVQASETFEERAWDIANGIRRALAYRGIASGMAEQQAPQPQCDGSGNLYLHGDTDPCPCPGCAKCRPEIIAEPAQAEVEAACEILSAPAYLHTYRDTESARTIVIAAARRCAHMESLFRELEASERQARIERDAVTSDCQAVVAKCDALRERCAQAESERDALKQANATQGGSLAHVMSERDALRDLADRLSLRD